MSAFNAVNPLLNVPYSSKSCPNFSSTLFLFCYLRCPQGMIGSRAMSHDSIFMADELLTDTEPAMLVSQENVHSKIKALQV